MTRYFYTEPLAAAWMAKHFGMKFLRCDGSAERDGWDETDIIHDFCTPAGDYCDSSIIWHVHPDSEHILKPQDGDMVETPHVVAEIVDRESRTEGYYEQEGVKILKRNGIPFIYPQSQ